MFNEAHYSPGWHPNFWLFQKKKKYILKQGRFAHLKDIIVIVSQVLEEMDVKNENKNDIL